MVPGVAGCLSSDFENVLVIARRSDIQMNLLVVLKKNINNGETTCKRNDRKKAEKQWKKLGNCILVIFYKQAFP